jgi:hypothetical protein
VIRLNRLGPLRTVLAYVAQQVVGLNHDSAEPGSAAGPSGESTWLIGRSSLHPDRSARTVAHKFEGRTVAELRRVLNQIIGGDPGFPRLARSKLVGVTPPVHEQHLSGVDGQLGVGDDEQDDGGPEEGGAGPGQAERDEARPPIAARSTP